MYVFQKRDKYKKYNTENNLINKSSNSKTIQQKQKNLFMQSKPIAKEKKTLKSIVKSSLQNIQRKIIQACWFTPHNLTIHFNKHRHEFIGIRTKKDYERRAQALIKGGYEYMKIRLDGRKCFFNNTRNEFAVLAGTEIVTFFKPTRGIDYYNSQPEQKIQSK